MPEEEMVIRPIRMEEEEDAGDDERRPRIGFGDRPGRPRTLAADDATSTQMLKLLNSLVHEREKIMMDQKMSTKEKLRLLEANHRTLLVIRGGTYRSFKTEQVVYSILLFSGIVMIVLALLNVYGGLPSEVTLAFVGTALGGTIATIAQKLGRI